MSLSSSQAVEADQLIRVGTELYRFISDAQQPRLRDGSWVRVYRDRGNELACRLQDMQNPAAAHPQTLAQSIDQLRDSLSSYAHELEQGPRAAKLKAARQSLVHGYEQMRVELRAFQRQHAPAARFTLRKLKTYNYARNLFHIASGSIGVVLWEFLLPQYVCFWIILGLAMLSTVLEATRRLSRRWNTVLIDGVFKRVVRPWERHQINSGTFYVFGLLVTVSVCHPHAVSAGALVLAFGDPIATIAGRTLGKHKLYKDKSLAGTAAFVIAAFGALIGFSFLAYPQLNGLSRFLFAAIVAMVGATVELFSDRVDDNFSIPVACGITASLLLM